MGQEIGPLAIDGQALTAGLRGAWRTAAAPGGGASRSGTRPTRGARSRARTSRRRTPRPHPARRRAAIPGFRRSAGEPLRANGVTPMLAPKALHPLLLEPTYWRSRLQELQPERQQLLFTPRPDLSTRERDVVEFRLRAHDGARLWGLFARPITDPGGWNRVGGPWRGALGRPARIRRVGPAERPEIDGAVLERGCAEFVFQEPAGRPLEDRVQAFGILGGMPAAP